MLQLDKTLHEHAMMLLSCLRFYIPENSESLLKNILENIIILANRDFSKIQEYGSLTKLASGCIQASIILIS